ncbi:MAG: hypothetical protein ACHP7O_02895 [Burkholderiales bacterium]
MKLSKIAAYLLPIAGVTLLAGCGGGSSSTSQSVAPPAMATIGGTITGWPAGTNYAAYTGAGVLLVNTGTGTNGPDTIVTDGSGSFIFDRKIPAGSTYNLTVLQEPGVYCTVGNGAGTVDQNADNVTNISVACQQAPTTGMNEYYYVAVTVSGLAPDNSVTFLDNGGDPLTANANGLYIFSNTLATGILPQASYNVTVSANPNGQTCTLTNAKGASSVAGVISVTATCQ